jgi:hypothetical protein
MHKIIINKKLKLCNFELFEIYKKTPKQRIKATK